jgi:GT2 family glycosyltransferase
MDLVRDLLEDLNNNCRMLSLEVLLTLNISNESFAPLAQYTYPVVVLKNNEALGFAQNHNQAFLLAKGEFFCILNPDIRLYSDPFSNLIRILEDESVGTAAPQVLDADGHVADSARKFPNPFAILVKLFGLKFQVQYIPTHSTIYPDWVAGMFMLFRHETFKNINGFDERYFLYYEDVDICARLNNLGKRVALCSDSKVIHLAQRKSHRSFQYLCWHIASMLKFFLSRAYWRLLWR